MHESLLKDDRILGLIVTQKPTSANTKVFQLTIKYAYI